MIGIIYGALVALVQHDVKKLVAYSSASATWASSCSASSRSTSRAWPAACCQMLNHGLSTGALFLLVGMIYERRHTRLIADFGGLWAVMPRLLAVFLMIVAVVRRAARPQRLRRRVPDPAGRLPGAPVACRRCRHRRHPRGASTCCGCTSGSSSARSPTRRTAGSPISPREWVVLLPLPCSSSGSACTRRPSPARPRRRISALIAQVAEQGQRGAAAMTPGNRVPGRRHRGPAARAHRAGRRRTGAAPRPGAAARHQDAPGRHRAGRHRGRAAGGGDAMGAPSSARSGTWCCSTTTRSSSTW